VIKIPDSLWNSTFYASLLVGACVRGATVSIIAPAAGNAPSSGFPQMSRAHEMLTRLILARAELADAIATAGGELRTGLYALTEDQDGFASRAGVWARQVTDDSALRAVLPYSAEVLAAVTDAASPARATNGADIGVRTGEPPKLHLKVQYFATGPLWDAIAGAPEWSQFMATYLRYREATYSTATDSADARRSPELEAIARISRRPRCRGAVRHRRLKTGLPGMFMVARSDCCSAARASCRSSTSSSSRHYHVGGRPGDVRR
jgi:hypothetical protein